jgi:hypothetical protein
MRGDLSTAWVLNSPRVSAAAIRAASSMPAVHERGAPYAATAAEAPTAAGGAGNANEGGAIFR